MYDVSELRPNGKEIAVAILIAVVLLVAVFGIGYLFGLRTNVPDHGDGAGQVGNQLEQTGTAIQHAKDGINEAQGTAGAVAGTVADAAATADYLSGTVNDSAELIADCQRIIKAVRNRGKK